MGYRGFPQYNPPLPPPANGSTLLSSSVQVRLLPSPSAPQVPLLAALAVPGSILRAIHTASAHAKILLFTKIPS